MARGKQSIVIAEDYTIVTLDGLVSLWGGMLCGGESFENQDREGHDPFRRYQ